jgi:hypothetical protein
LGDALVSAWAQSTDHDTKQQISLAIHNLAEAYICANGCHMAAAPTEKAAAAQKALDEACYKAAAEARAKSESQNPSLDL